VYTNSQNQSVLRQFVAGFTQTAVNMNR